MNSTHAGGGKDVIDRVVRVGLEVHGAAGRDPRPLLVVSEDDGCVVSSVALFSSSFLRDDVCERPTTTDKSDGPALPSLHARDPSSSPTTFLIACA